MSAKYTCLWLIPALAVTLCFGTAQADENQEEPPKTIIDTETIKSGESWIIQGDDKLIIAEKVGENPSGMLLINDGGLLHNQGVIENAGSLNNNGTIKNQKEINNSGSLTNKGSIINDVELINSGSLTNKGSIINKENSEFTNSGSLANDHSFVNDGKLTNSGTLTSTGSLVNNTKLVNTGIITINNGEFTNNGVLQNDKTLTLDNKVFHSGINGSIVNSGTIMLGDIIDDSNKSTIHNAFNSITNTSGKISFIGTEAITEELSLQSGSGGTVDTGTVTEFAKLDVKDAKLTLTLGTTFNGDVSANTLYMAKNEENTFNSAVTVQTAIEGAEGGTNNFNGNVTAATINVNGTDNYGGVVQGDMNIAADMGTANFKTNSSYAGGIINNDHVLKFGNGSTFSNGTIYNNSTLTFGTGSAFTEGSINNSGTVTLGDMTGIGKAFSSINNAVGATITFDEVTTITEDLVLKTDSAGKVITGSATEFEGIVDVKNATLDITDSSTFHKDVSANTIDGSTGNDIFKGTVTAENIIANGETVFEKTITGNLTANAEVTLDPGASFSNGNLTLNADLKNNGNITIANDKMLYLDADLINLDSATLTFEKEAKFTVAPAATGYIKNENSATITADVGMNNDMLSALVGRTNLEGGSNFNFKAISGSAILTTELAFNNIDLGANVNFDATGGTLTFGKGYTFENANLSLANGSFFLGNSVHLSAGSTGTFNLANSATLYNDIAGNKARITASQSNINGGIDIGTSTGSIFFDGNLTFGAGSSIHLVARTDGIGKIGTYNGGKVDIGNVTYISIDGTLEDARNAGAFIIAGEVGSVGIAALTPAVNSVDGVGNLHDTSISSRFEFSLDSEGNVIVTGVNDTEDVIGGGDTGGTDGGGGGGGSGDGGSGSGSGDGGTGGSGSGGSGGSGSGSGTGSGIGGNGDGSGAGGSNNNYLSENKINGSHYIDDLYGNVDPDLERDFGYSIDRIAVLDFETRMNAFGQLIGEYGANSADGAVHATELFFKTVYNHMNFGIVQQAAQETAARPGSTNALAQMESNGTTVRDANGYRYQESNSSLWAGFLGSWAKQKDKNRLYGYDYDTYGFILGYDRRIDRLSIGFAAAYQRGYLDVDDVATKFKSHFMNLGLYGSYMLENGLYAKAGIGYAHGWNKYDVNMILGGGKHGSYNNQAYSANTEIGYAIGLPANFMIIPSVGLRYTHLRQDAWTESLQGGDRNIANWFDKKKYNYVDIPLDVRLAKSFCAGGMVLTPEIRAGWTHAAKHERPNATTGFVGTSRGFTVFGVNPGRNRFIAGASFKGRFTDNFEASLDYNLETRSKYTDHSLSLSAVFTF